MNEGQPAVLFADTISLVIGAIREGLAITDIVVDTAVPNDPGRPDMFITVRRHGGPRRDIVTDQAQISLESYAQTDFDARANLQQARAWVNAMRGTVRDGVSIYRIDEFSGPGDLPDPVSELPRSTMTFLVATRGTSLHTN